jgi:hypothetical protein
VRHAARPAGFGGEAALRDWGVEPPGAARRS